MSKTVGILGLGRFGQTFADLLQQAQIPCLAFDPHHPPPEELRCSSLEELVQQCRLLCLAVPIPQLEPVLAQIRPHLSRSTIVFDVSSVKVVPTQLMQEALGAAVPWVATHPLFGPNSVATCEQLQAVICPNPHHPKAVSEIEQLYQEIGCIIHRQGPRRHDRSMAYTHALTFFITKGLIDVGVDETLEATPPSFRALANTIDSVRSDAGHLFSAMQRLNPFSRQARKELVEALITADERIRSGDEEEIPTSALPSDEPGAATEKAVSKLQHVRQQIDACDHYLVELFAKRQSLALQAGLAKEQLGRPVKDTGREEALLQMRRQWGHNLGLRPDDIGRIFDLLMEISRSTQQRRSLA